MQQPTDKEHTMNKHARNEMWSFVTVEFKHYNVNLEGTTLLLPKKDSKHDSSMAS